MDKNTSFLGKQSVTWVLGLVTFVLIFIYHTYPLGLSDFWWHLNTGRWIWSEGGLPSDDPFLFSSPSPLDDRASLILRGYPLFQLLILGVYSMGGIYALMVLKGLLMTLFYAILWNQLWRNGLHSLLALAVVAALPLLFFRFDELRPQVFSFIGTLLVLQWTEYIIANGKQGRLLKWNSLVALPVIMLLWANLHRGFIIGVGILLVYLFSEWVARKRGINALPDDAFRRFAIVVFVSIGIAFFNPAGVTAMWASFTEVSGPFSKVIDEFLGTIRYFEFIGMKQFGYLVVAVAVIPFLALLFKWRKLSVAHFILVVSFLIAGILSFRFSLMMVTVVLSIASIYFADGLNRGLSIGKGLTIILLWCLSTGFLANSAFSRTALAAALLEKGVIPSAAVDYLAQSNISGNIYNFFEYGGYTSWRLYPRKIFIDQRNLSWDIYEEYSMAWRGNYAEVFQKYNVGTVFYPVNDRATGRPSRLVAGLLNDNHWAVGYYDRQNIIFIRPDINSHLPFLSKQAVVDDILKRLNGTDKR